MRGEERGTVRKGRIGLEDGIVCFFYRPLTDEKRGAGGAAVLGFVLHPSGRRRYRYVKLDAATLPGEDDADGSVSGTVVDVTVRLELIRERMSQSHRRFCNDSGEAVGSARVCAEGVYSIVPYENKIYFAYVVRESRVSADLRRRLGIEPEAAYLLGIYNPQYFGEEIESEPAPHYPVGLRRRLGTSRLLLADGVEFLDTQRTRIGLFSRTSEIARQHAVDMEPMWEGLFSSEALRELRHSRERRLSDRKSVV
jgi:hypothetical protein